MGRNCVRYRGRSPTPHPSSDSTHFIVKKTVTKEKTSNWGWTRASNTSSVSSVTEPARSASPVRVTRYRESEHQRHRHRDRSPHHHRRHQSRHETQHLHSHPRAIDHQQDEHRRHRRHRRRYSEDAPPPRVTDKEVIHKRCHCEAKPSPTVKSPHICPSPILVAVPIKPSLNKPSPKMEEVGGFAYEEWCKRRECVAVPTETIAPKSSVSNRSTQTQGRTQSEVSDQDNNYRYVAMREPGPQDAVPVAYALYPQPGYTYMFPPQPFAAMAAPPTPPAPTSAPAPAAAPSSTHSKKEEYHHHRHYVREQVREKSIRAASEPPTIEKAAPPPSAPPAKMPAMTYSPFPFAMPTTAIPVAYAMPTYPVPVQAETASSTSSSKPKPDQRIWVGRTKKQVDEDNAKIAHKEGVYKPNEMVPKDAAPDQLFWCIEPDDTNTLRRFCTIQEDLQPGKWKVDPRYGNAYFVRDKVEQEKKK